MLTIKKFRDIRLDIMGDKTLSAKQKAPAKKTAKAARSAAGLRPAMAKTSESPRVKAKVVKHPKSGRPPVTPDPNRIPAKRGRPLGIADVWTPERIEQVAQLMWDYIEATECPTEAEFCIKNAIHVQRLFDIPELRELKEFILAKRQAYTINVGIKLGKEDGPKGAFLRALAANAGPFSLVEKSELSGKDGGPIPVETIKRVVVDKNDVS